MKNLKNLRLALVYCIGTLLAVAGWNLAYAAPFLHWDGPAEATSYSVFCVETPVPPTGIPQVWTGVEMQYDLATLPVVIGTEYACEVVAHDGTGSSLPSERLVAIAPAPQVTVQLLASPSRLILEWDR